MKYRRATDIFLSSGIINFSVPRTVSTAMVLNALLADDRFTGAIKLSNDDHKERAGILVARGKCIGGIRHGQSSPIQMLDAGTINDLTEMAQQANCHYDAYVLNEKLTLSLSSLFRGYPDETYSGPRFIEAWEQKMEHCRAHQLTGCFSVTTSMCTGLILVHQGTQLGIYIPEQQIWISKEEAISDFMSAASANGRLDLSILNPADAANKNCGIA